MTTNRNLDHLSGANRKRVKHPARSARILTTGLSIASVLGITSGYSLLPTNKQVTVDNKSVDQISGVALVALKGLVAPRAAVASQTIAAISPVQTSSLAPVQTAPQLIVVAPQVQTKVKRQTIQAPVSTTSSGSK